MRYSLGGGRCRAQCEERKRNAVVGGTEGIAVGKSDEAGTESFGEEGFKSFQFPTGLHHELIVVLDAMSDKIDHVVDKLVSSIGLMEDAESRQLGNYELEVQRLRKAWEMAVRCEHNARKHGLFATVLQCFIVGVALAITVLTLSYAHLRSEGELDTGLPSPNSSFTEPIEYLTLGIGVLPLVATFLAAVEHSFSPLDKWAQLATAATRIVSEIYRYRARVGDYKLDKATVDTRELMKSSKVVMALFPQKGKGSGPTAEEMPEDSNDAALGDWAPARKHPVVDLKPVPRRVALRNVLEEVQTTLAQSNLRQDFFAQAPPHMVEQRIARLVGGRAIGARTAGLSGSRSPTDETAKSSAFLPSAPASPQKVSLFQVFEESDSKALADDGLRPLSAQDYTKVRMETLLSYFEMLSPKLVMRARVLRVLTITGTAVSALLAFLGYRLWIALVVAVVGAVTTMKDYMMLETRLSATNAAIMKVKNLQLWWDSLTLVQKRLPEHCEYLVETCESLCDADMVWRASVALRRNNIPSSQRDGEREESAMEKGNVGNT